MQDKKELVFVEVRYRANNDYDSASDSVDQQKIQKLTVTKLINPRALM
ncbi:MAG: YraN family protein [Gammaproteobacteria bacterium]